MKLFSGPILFLLLATLVPDGGVVITSYLWLLAALLVLAAGLAISRRARGLLFGAGGGKMPAVLAVLSMLAFIGALVLGRGVVGWLNG